MSEKVKWKKKPKCSWNVKCVKNVKTEGDDDYYINEKVSHTMCATVVQTVTILYYINTICTAIRIIVTLVLYNL